MDKPSSEATTWEGWSSGENPGLGQWMGELSGAAVDYNGRQVTEEPGTDGTAVDSCHFSGSTVDEAELTGGIWNVGFSLSSSWGDDNVGWSSYAVEYYRQYFRTPCSAYLPQAMAIYYDGHLLSTYVYAQGADSFGIPNLTQVTSSRDGQQQIEKCCPLVY
jgi:hypothetical protein